MSNALKLSPKQKGETIDALEAFMECAKIDYLRLALRQMIMIYLKHESPDTPPEYEQFLYDMSRLFDFLDSLQDTVNG
jgi:hypothetical protein